VDGVTVLMEGGKRGRKKIGPEGGWGRWKPKQWAHFPAASVYIEKEKKEGKKKGMAE